KVLLRDFGPNGVFDESGDDTFHELVFTAPVLKTKEWISLDIPLTDFVGLTNRANLAQIVFSGDLPNVFADNIYFYKGGNTGGNDNKPTTPAATPTKPASDVKSLFSDAYTDEPLDFINGFWGGSTTQSAKITVQGDSIIQYTELNFVGIQFTNPTIDVNEMTHIHVDIWTPDATNGGQVFRVKLRDFGPNGVFDEAGDDTEHELTFTSPTLQSEQWISLDLPLSDFTGLTTKGNMAQFILSGDLPNVFVDNVYFYK
ncbi:MAG: glycoside hydrolase family 16 protein, partial [Bacteroidota bacterium]